jgi:hypothetical protein
MRTDQQQIPRETFTVLDPTRPAILERGRAGRVTDELLAVFGADHIRRVAVIGVRAPFEYGALVGPSRLHVPQADPRGC